MQDLRISLDLLVLLTGALYKISPQDLHERSLCSQDLLVSLDLLGLFTQALYKISSQAPYERSQYKSSLKSPDIPGPPRSLNRSSLQDLLTRPPWEISIQELSTRSLHRTPIWDISKQDLRISLDLLGLFTGALYKISSQDLYERSLYKISWYPWTFEMSSLQDLFKRPPSESNTQKVPRGLRGRNQNRHRATARAIRHAQSPERVAFANIKISTAPQRDSKNQCSDRTLTSELQYEMRFFDVLWHKYCACHEKMTPRHTKSCNFHAK